MMHSLLLALLPTFGGDLQLDTVSSESIRADVEFLSCDDMRGRDTPSLELRAAARYLRARVQHLGFTPGGDDGSFFDRYFLATKRLGTASSLTLIDGEREEELVFGDDYLLPSTADLFSHELSAELVWCGDGEREDFEAASVEGRWAVCRDTGLSSMRRRRNAERAGAAGVIVLAPEDREPLRGKWDQMEKLLGRGFVRWPKEAASQKKKERLPQVVLAPEASQKVAALVSRRGGQPVSLRSKRVLEDRVELENVCALWPGSDPELAQEVIIFSAHYDHVGAQGDVIYNGADDNASGTSTLLAVADALAERGPLARSVLLVWVSAEEKGLFGSRAWSQNPTLGPGLRPVCNLNLDMVGRNAPDELYVTPSSKHSAYNGLVSRLDELAPLEGFPSLGSADRYYERSDHAEFAKLGIPVAFLFAGEHEDYHKPGDTADKIDVDKVRRVTRLLLRMLDELQAPELDL